MPLGPVARIGDGTAHGNPLAPGPPSKDVFIGGQPAWLGCPPEALAAVMKAIADAAESIAKAAAANVAAKGTPGAAAAEANLAKAIADGIAAVAAAMANTGASIHACAIIKLLIPDGPGIVTTGSTTVRFNDKPACRVGDVIQEVTSVNSIASGLPTVIVGG
ncbi:hypothetical protein EON79_21290 [bacterium]|nr:MAG: hypothetical protein EON79_21290 [bacterium]